jgi:hypothetical protein
MTFIKVFQRRKWPVVVPLYDLRRCPDCYSLVARGDGQDAHARWHEALEVAFAAAAGDKETAEQGPWSALIDGDDAIDDTDADQPDEEG